MGCASSGPAKDLATAAVNGAEDLQKSLQDASDTVENIDFDNAVEDLKQVGERMKDAMVDGVVNIMDSVLGDDDKAEEREDGDGGSEEENADDTLSGSQITVKKEDEEGLDAIERDEEAEAQALGEEKDSSTTETESTAEPVAPGPTVNGHEE